RVPFRSQEADDIDDCRSERRIVEIVEAPGVACERKLLYVRVAVHPHLRHAADLFREDRADALHPWPVDEAEVRVGIGAKTSEQQFWRRGDGVGLWTQLRVRGAAAHRQQYRN